MAKTVFKVSTNDALKITHLIIKIQKNLNKDEAKVIRELEKIETSLRKKEGSPINPQKILKILKENEKTPQLIKIEE